MFFSSVVVFILPKSSYVFSSVWLIVPDVTLLVKVFPSLSKVDVSTELSNPFDKVVLLTLFKFASLSTKVSMLSVAFPSLS